MEYCRIAPDVKLGRDVHLDAFVDLHGCAIGSGSRIGTFVEIQQGATIGRRCKISSHTFICEGVTIADEVFVGHGVAFVNDRYSRAGSAAGSLPTGADGSATPTQVGRRASIGSGAVISCGVTIGAGAMIGAGAVVTEDVPADAIVAGIPPRAIRELVYAE